jgi:nicotinamide-nucleotide adenylyltransferase
MQALEAADEAIIVVGSAQESFTVENPLTAGERIEALRLMLSSELGRDYCRRIVAIAPVPDIAMNKVWVQYLKMMLPAFDAVITGNELVAMLFEDMGYPVLRPRLHMREVCSGTIIRKAAAAGSEWKRCLHPSVAAYLESIGFPERLRRLYGGSRGER